MERDVIREYVCGWCPSCLSYTTEKAADDPRCADCGYAFALHLVMPYDSDAWEYSPELIEEFQKHEGLRLMAKFNGRDPEMIEKFPQVRELYLSRYRGFQFSFLGGMPALSSFELDFTSVTDLDGIGSAGNLSVLQLTECRKLTDISAVEAAQRLRLIHFALCSQLRDLSPLGSLPELRKLFVEGRAVASLQFLPACRQLTDVVLAVDRIEDRNPEPLLEMKSLRRLTVASKALPRGFAKQLRSALPGCEVEVFTKV